MGVQRAEVFAQAGQMELLSRLLDGLAQRSTDAAPFGAEQAEQPDCRSAQMHRNVLVRGHAGRGEDQSESEGQYHSRPNHVPETDLEVHLHHPVVAGCHEHQAGRDQPAGIKLPSDQDAGDHHRDHRGDAGGGHGQPRDKGIIAEQCLEHRRQRHARAIDHGEGQEEDDAADGEIPLAEHPEIDDRVSAAHLTDDQQHQPDHEQDQERLQSPEWVAQPVPFPPLAEHDLPGAHDQHQQAQADGIEIQRLAAQLRPLALEVLGIVDSAVSTD